MRRIVLAASGIQLVIHVLQIVLLARTHSVDAAGTLRVEAWAGLIGAVWYVATMLTTNALTGKDLAARIVASSVVVILLGAATWLAFPHLPAGRAFIRRGVRIPRLPESLGLS
jgi:hypothetical protein